jgi:peptidoglycan/xylan/chitin deacetylase (PgdA/CDA1 family)
MQIKKWLLAVVLGAALGFICLAGFNYVTDPFGVFGDPVLDWYGYDITNNPRLAKFGYLEAHHQDYNAYILGSSKSSSLDPERLNQYYPDARFYNLMMYGANYTHMEDSLRYLADNYEVRHIVIALGISEITDFGLHQEDIKLRFHAAPAGEALLPFYARFLGLNPQYGMDKFAAWLSRDQLPSPSPVDVFLPEKGVYNKVRRDQENIVNLYSYAARIGDGSFLRGPDAVNLASLDDCLAALQRMKDFCAERGISWQVVSTPNYCLEIQSYDPNLIAAYWTRMAEITEYWNFSGYNALSGDPRFFYDTIHFRNLTGEMVLGRMFADDTVYVPEDFGVYVTADNAAAVTEALLTPRPGPGGFINGAYPAVPEVKIPILLYHQLAETAEEVAPGIVTADKFAADLAALDAAGWSTVTLTDLIDYADGKKTLPEKPVVISFDDGYRSNYLYAYPALRERGMRAVISLIGWSVGRDTRLDGVTPIFPHFSWAEAEEMVKSGVMELQSHSYDLHENAPGGREGAMIKPDESTAAYAEVLAADQRELNAAFRAQLNLTPAVFTYPYGAADARADYILKTLGYRATLLTTDEISRVTQGNPDSLYGLGRITIENTTDINAVLARMESEVNPDGI